MKSTCIWILSLWASLLYNNMLYNNNYDIDDDDNDDIDDDNDDDEHLHLEFEPVGQAGCSGSVVHCPRVLDIKIWVNIANIVV